MPSGSCFFRYSNGLNISAIFSPNCPVDDAGIALDDPYYFVRCILVGIIRHGDAVTSFHMEAERPPAAELLQGGAANGGNSNEENSCFMAPYRLSLSGDRERRILTFPDSGKE